MEVHGGPGGGHEHHDDQTGTDQSPETVHRKDPRPVDQRPEEAGLQRHPAVNRGTTALTLAEPKLKKI